MSITSEYKKALQEIGDVKPWPEEGLFYFQHEAYPVVDYMDETIEDTIKGYKRVLKEWIQDRLNGNVADIAEKITSGRGGYRANAGRRKNTVKSIRTYMPEDVVLWLKQDPKHLEQVRKLM